MSDKQNDSDSEDNIEPPAFGPAALGLHRVGTVLPRRERPAAPIQVLNARGMPARIRKRNKLFFDDDIVNDAKAVRQSPVKKLLKPISPVKQPVVTPTKHLKKRKGVVSKYMKTPTKTPETKKFTPKKEIVSATKSSTVVKSAPKSLSDVPSSTSAPQPVAPVSTISAVDQAIGKRIGFTLRNLLKLPKAHKWVSYEWFYSYIDRPLLLGENEFQVCLKESFPQLKTRQLTRAEWSKIRRLMGKPRRSSQAFFDEERRELERRRQKIRLLQSRKCGDVSFVRDLPAEIPLTLPVGTKVTARLRQPQDGIFTGTVEAIYSMSSEYRITFDRTGLGTHSVPDYEVFATDPVDTIPVNSITQNFRQKINGLCYVPSPITSKFNRSDPLLNAGIESVQKLKNFIFPKESIGGFQLKLLELIVRARKTIAAKQMKLSRLKNMNTEAEMYKSYNEPFPEDYQQRYASIIISMEKLNRDNQMYLSQIQAYTRDLTKDSRIEAMLQPSYLREKCRELGADTVQKNNHTIQPENEPMLRLINDLAMIMYVASKLSADGQNYQISKVLEGCLEETKNRLDPDNIDAFQVNVHAHIRHLEMDLDRLWALSVVGLLHSNKFHVRIMIDFCRDVDDCLVHFFVISI